MAIQYVWTISKLECKPHEGDVADVVVNIHWTLEGTDGEYTANTYGTVATKPYEPGEPFTPYDQLTKEQVVGWVEEALGTEHVQQYKDSIAQQIEQQINPLIVTPPIPWGV